ncbi:lysophospholipid acyltransferase family protein [Enemella sp. A6]|uniref:lysophospholipid acyltransferase family protein n=1 Tax=Enemella sp. A6 TaxID=3440152 RepID=UPI003EBBFBCF
MSLLTHPHQRSLVTTRPAGTGLLTALRPWADFGLRRWFDISTEGTHLVPPEGPALLAVNHLGVLDGPLAVITAPRPTIALAKADLFRGLVGRVLTSMGQIPVDRNTLDVGAIRRCLDVLERGYALTIFPEGRRATGDMTRLMGGITYLAMVTGAPIIPVTLLGTRLPGQTAKELPGRGARIHIEYGAPITDVPELAWPRTRQSVAQWTGVLADRLSAEVRRVELSSGMRLPGEPLPH